MKSYSEIKLVELLNSESFPDYSQYTDINDAYDGRIKDYRRSILDSKENYVFYKADLENLSELNFRLYTASTMCCNQITVRQ